MEKTKNILLIIGISLFVILGFGALIYFGVLNSIVGSECSFGSWSDSYDLLTDTHIITGSYPLSRRGSDASCFAPPGADTSNCVDITDKLVTSTGHCKVFSDWSGSLVLRYEYDINNDLSFDGCRVSFGDSGNPWDQREINFEIRVSPKQVAINSPTIPQAGGFNKFLQSIINWIKGLFTGTPQTILGATTIEPNTLQTYNIDISTIAPDSDWSDGTYQVQYSNWALIDKDGNIKQQGTWEVVNGRYTQSVTITTPSNIGDYILLGMITQYDMTYNYQTKVWTSSEEVIMNKEAINLKNKYTVIAPTNPQAGGFTKFWGSILNFFKNLFGGR